MFYVNFGEDINVSMKIRINIYIHIKICFFLFIIIICSTWSIFSYLRPLKIYPKINMIHASYNHIFLLYYAVRNNIKTYFFRKHLHNNFYYILFIHIFYLGKRSIPPKSRWGSTTRGRKRKYYIITIKKNTYKIQINIFLTLAHVSRAKSHETPYGIGCVTFSIYFC